MKQPHVRIEMTKGDLTPKSTWVVTTRVIERDRTQVVTRQEFEFLSDLKAALKASEK